ncbi:hypothetical protein HDU84_003999 [Entophlyctis sp. JEL0112]|nr:hypothetical protein HDU84_003999 [Entophlyctis sp. JEL0112]
MIPVGIGGGFEGRSTEIEANTLPYVNCAVPGRWIGGSVDKKKSSRMKRLFLHQTPPAAAPSTAPSASEDSTANIAPPAKVPRVDDHKPQQPSSPDGFSVLHIKELLGDADATVAFQKSAIFRRLLEYRRLHDSANERIISLESSLKNKEVVLQAALDCLSKTTDDSSGKVAEDIAAIRVYDETSDSSLMFDSAFVRAITQPLPSLPSPLHSLDSLRSGIQKSIGKLVSRMNSSAAMGSSDQIDKLQARCHVLSSENVDLKVTCAAQTQRLTELQNELDSVKAVKMSVERKLDRLRFSSTAGGSGAIPPKSEANGNSTTTTVGPPNTNPGLVNMSSSSSLDTTLEEAGGEWEIIANSRMKEIELLNSQKLELTQAFELYKLRNPAQSVSELTARQLDELEYLRGENMVYKKRLDNLTLEYEELQSERRKFIEQVEAEELARRKVLDVEMKKLETDLLRVRANRDALQESFQLQKEKEAVELHHQNEMKFLAGAQKSRILELESKIERLKVKLLINDTDAFLHEFFKSAENSSENQSIYSELRNRLNASEKRTAELEAHIQAFESATKDIRDKQEILLSERALRLDLENTRAEFSKFDPELAKKVADLEGKIEFYQKNEVLILQEIDELTASWTDLNTQNQSKVFNLTDKEEQILKLVAERTKVEQKCEKLTKERNMINNQAIALKRQSERQLEQIRKLEERERQLLAQLQTVEKDFSAKSISADVHRRKVSELSQKQTELFDKAEKLSAKLAETERVLGEKLKTISDDAIAQKRLLERIEVLKKKLENVPKTSEMADLHLKQENEDLKHELQVARSNEVHAHILQNVFGRPGRVATTQMSEVRSDVWEGRHQPVLSVIDEGKRKELKFEMGDSEAEELDGFECRAQFKELLDTLTASDHVVKRVAQFAAKPSNREHAAIMYGCVRERLDATPTLNRLPILYFLDSICQLCVRTQRKSGGAAAAVRSSTNSLGWLELVGRDLAGIVAMLVPESDAVNLDRVRKFMKVWRTGHVFGTEDLERAEAHLAAVETRTVAAAASAPTATGASASANDLTGNASGRGATDRPVTYSRHEIQRRIEDDRDRHKKSREEGWYRQQNHYQMYQEKHQPFQPLPLDKSVFSEEFAEAWAKIPGLSMDPCREWDLISSDLLRFDAEHEGYI